MAGAAFTASKVQARHIYELRGIPGGSENVVASHFLGIDEEHQKLRAACLLHRGVTDVGNSSGNPQVRRSYTADSSSVCLRTGETPRTLRPEAGVPATLSARERTICHDNSYFMYFTSNLGRHKSLQVR